MKHQKIINYEINGDICEFRNNDFTDVTLSRGDIITVTWNFSFDGERLHDKSNFGKKVGIL